MSIQLLSIFSIFLLLNCDSEKVITIYLVRHAEKDLTDTTDNPLLTQNGRVRAEKLKELLSNEPVTHLYSTAFNRNIQTVKPLAEAKNLEILIYDWHGWKPMLDQLIRLEGLNLAVICGHGDNLLPMIDYLEGDRPLDSLGTNEYDKIFKITMARQATRVSLITY